MMSASPCPPPPQRAAPNAAAAAAKLQCKLEHDARPGHSDGVTDRDCTSVDIDAPGVDAEFGGRGDADGRERFIDLDEVKISWLDPLTPARVEYGRGGLVLQA